MSDAQDSTPADEPTVADRIAAAGSSPAPDHPATGDHTGPSSGEQISRGADSLAVPGDDALAAGGRGTDGDEGVPPVGP